MKCEKIMKITFQTCFPLLLIIYYKYLVLSVNIMLNTMLKQLQVNSPSTNQYALYNHAIVLFKLLLHIDFIHENIINIHNDNSHWFNYIHYGYFHCTLLPSSHKRTKAKFYFSSLQGNKRLIIFVIFVVLLFVRVFNTL